MKGRKTEYKSTSLLRLIHHYKMGFYYKYVYSEGMNKDRRQEEAKRPRANKKRYETTMII